LVRQPAGQWEALGENFIGHGSEIAVGACPSFHFEANGDRTKIYRVSWTKYSDKLILIPLPESEASQRIYETKEPFNKAAALLGEFGKSGDDLILWTEENLVFWEKLPELLKQLKLGITSSPTYLRDYNIQDSTVDMGNDIFPPHAPPSFTNYSERLLSILHRIASIAPPSSRKEVFLAFTQALAWTGRSPLDNLHRVENFLNKNPSSEEISLMIEYVQMNDEQWAQLLTEDADLSRSARTKAITFRFNLREGSQVDAVRILAPYAGKQRASLENLNLIEAFLNKTVLPGDRLEDWVEMTEAQRAQFIETMNLLEDIAVRQFAPPQNYDRHAVSEHVVSILLSSSLNDRQKRERIGRIISRFQDGGF